MITHMPGFQSFLRFIHHFILAKLAYVTSNIGKIVIWLSDTLAFEIKNNFTMFLKESC